MTTHLRDTGVTAWLETDTAVRHEPLLNAESTHGRIVVGTGPGTLALFIADPAACYRLAGVAVTLAKALEAHQRKASSAPVGAPKATTGNTNARDEHNHPDHCDECIERSARGEKVGPS